MLYVKKQVATFLVLLLSVIVVASTFNLTQAASYSYQFYGPDWDTGGVATGNSVTCTMRWVNGSYYTFTLDAATYDSGVILSSSPVNQIFWNASSALNYTRFIHFQMDNPATTNVAWLWITNPSEPSGIYTFSVADFYGMSNAYLRTSLSDNGVSQYLVEQVNLESAGTPSFVMQQYHTYTLTFLCDQGSYSQQFTAENTLSNSLIVLAGVFPVTNTSVPVADAQRLNATLIGVTYSDPASITTSGSIIITHKSGVTTINDYGTNTITNSTSVLWNAAMAGTSYNVNVTATINGVQYIWMLSVPEQAGTNPFDGKFDWLGQNIPTMPHVQTGWPEGMTSTQIGQIIGASIVMLFLCIGSFRSAGACCILSWIIFGVLVYLGWMGAVTPYTIPQFALSGVVALLVHFSEAKDTVREI
jgi:hypothetical protein